jgi:hypothetical protein
LVRDGATLTIDAIEQLHEPISELARMLESALLVPIQVDLYASWQDKPLRGLRWDDHDTLLFQITGQKNWSLFQPTAYYPTIGQSPPEPNGEPNWSGAVHPGDLLYLPRGWWYRDSALDGPALYLAATFKRLRGMDLMVRLLERSSGTDLLRADIPRLPSEQNAYLAFFEREVADLCVAPGLLLGLLKEAQDASEPRVAFGFPWCAGPDVLPPSDDYEIFSLRRFPRSELPAIGGDDGLIEFRHGSRVFRLGTIPVRMLERLSRPPVVNIRDLLREYGDEMPPLSVLGHLSDLIERGLASAREPRRDS